ncbi:hypothetical protein MPSEU_001043000 [Mayamaea pseudoterrestris]|nr:hypothetical protein MPSEU_001043000 [Mayamaea pseudoterrestris]
MNRNRHIYQQNSTRLHFHWLLVLSILTCLSALSPPDYSRRAFVAAASVGALVAPLQPCAAIDKDQSISTLPDSSFKTLGYGQEEYTNSITASRDTNISPREAYDVIRDRIPPANPGGSTQQRVLDVGAGAGVSTAVLYNELGYHFIDAIDWSADAWDENVVACPDSVKFYALADDYFFQKQAQMILQHQDAADAAPVAQTASSIKYSIICYNFAINFRKAEKVAQQHLTDDGILLAPVNDKADYWYKQTYYMLNSQGKVLWKSAAEVGAWSVQFQPDVTSDTCTGIWCGGFNSFRNR